MDSSAPSESMTVDILGTRLRVRVPADQKEDVLRAAQLVQEQIEAGRDAAEPPDRAVIRVALELAYESITIRRDVEATLQRLLHELDRNLDA